MNKKKVITIVTISILVLLNVVFYMEGQRLQNTKMNLEMEVQLLQQEVDDKRFEYELLKQQVEELQLELDSKPQ